MASGSRKKLKRFFWTKIRDNAVGPTIFAGIDTDEIELDTEMLDAMFEVKETGKVLGGVSSGAGSGEQEEGNAGVPVLSPRDEAVRDIQALMGARCTQRLEIMLSVLASSGLTPSAMVDALIRMDGTLLGAERVARLEKHIPDEETWAQITGCLGSLDSETVEALEHDPTISPAVQLLVGLYSVPRVHARMRAFQLALAFDGTMDDLEHDIRVITSACNQVMSSPALGTVLQYVLALGNYLNSRSKLVASGFKLSALLKLADTKTTDQSTSLLHILVDALDSSGSQLCIRESLHEQLSDVGLGSDLEIGQVAGRVAMLQDAHRHVRAELDAVAALGASGGLDPNDAFVSVLSEFHAASSSRLAAMESEVTTARDAQARMLLFFGEPESSSSSSFLGDLSEFCELMDKAGRDNARKAAVLARQQRARVFAENAASESPIKAKRRRRRKRGGKDENVDHLNVAGVEEEEEEDVWMGGGGSPYTPSHLGSHSRASPLAQDLLSPESLASRLSPQLLDRLSLSPTRSPTVFRAHHHVN